MIYFEPFCLGTLLTSLQKNANPSMASTDISATARALRVCSTQHARLSKLWIGSSRWPALAWLKEWAAWAFLSVSSYA